MSKLSRIPRVSILIPFQGENAAFEETLVSVLEQQPTGCEVIVAHNGTYTDPFELSEEVKFVVARSSNLVDLVRDGADAATAQFVHIAGSGLIASDGWLTHGLASFEDQHIAAVAPTIVDKHSGAVISAGWADQPGRLYQNITSPAATRIGGCHLNAAFFRRSVLKGLLNAVAPAVDHSVTAGYAFGCLLKNAGWKVASASQCILGGETQALLDDTSDTLRGQQLAAVRATVTPRDGTPALGAALKEGLFGNSSIGEAIGYLRHSGFLRATRRLIDPNCVAAFDTDADILKMPLHEKAERRAA